MRLIYTDEAGTSKDEPVRVVASIIIDADRDYLKIQDEIRKSIELHVPEEYRNDFFFHGKEVFNGGKFFDRKKWPLERRLDFFKEILCIPYVNDIPIAVGIVHKGSFDEAIEQPFRTKSGFNIERHHFEHLIAYQYCMERSDHFLRKYLEGKEFGVVISENVPEMRRFLEKAGLMYRGYPIHIPKDGLRKESWQEQLGVELEDVTYKIKNIIDAPHFTDKKMAPMLQLADACAFAFRRWLTRQPHGDDLILAMLGPEVGLMTINDSVWFSLSSSSLFNISSYKQVGIIA